MFIPSHIKLQHIVFEHQFHPLKYTNANNLINNHFVFLNNEEDW
jgi:hypothetical protein